jgi:hypothetical protein
LPEEKGLGKIVLMKINAWAVKEPKGNFEKFVYEKEVDE